VCPGIVGGTLDHCILDEVVVLPLSHP
jgi:hypothetical protein